MFLFVSQDKTMLNFSCVVKHARRNKQTYQLGTAQ